MPEPVRDVMTPDPVGVLSLGDVTLDRDEGSALGEISAAPPNR